MPKFPGCDSGKLQTNRRVSSPPTLTRPQITVEATTQPPWLPTADLSRFACFSNLLRALSDFARSSPISTF